MEEADLTGLTSAELMIIIANVEDLEEVADALTELSRRDPQKAASCCLEILEQDVGDEFLQAIAFHLLSHTDLDRADAFMKRKMQTAPKSLLGAFMDHLSMERFQPYGESLSSEFLTAVEARYLALRDKDQVHIQENYEWFKKSFEGRFKPRCEW